MTFDLKTSWEFERLSDVQAGLGESPVWSSDENCIWWVDIEGHQLLRTEANSGATQAWPTPEEIGFVTPGKDDAIFVGMETGLFSFKSATGTFQLVHNLNKKNIRFNDATTDAAGRLWAGTMHMENNAPVGTLYRIDPDLGVHAIETGFMTLNGLAVDTTRQRLYFSDSHPTVQTIWKCDLDIASGKLGEKQVFARLHDLDGRPDGGAVDDEGNYWIAGVGGGKAFYVYSPDGELLAEIAMPMESPTKLAFGGADQSSVFITSKGDGNKGPGGYLFKVSPKISGPAVPLFG